MKNFIQAGNVITAVAPVGGVSSGDGVVYGALFGVAATDAAEGEEYELAVTGVFELPKAAGVINAGAKVWWDNTAKAVENATGAGLFLVGTATEAALDAGATVRVRLDGVAVTAAAA